MTEKQYKEIITLLLAELERKNTDIYLLKLKIEELKKGGGSNG